MTILSLTLENANQDFALTHDIQCRYVKLIGYSSDGEQHLHLGFLDSSPFVDCRADGTHSHNRLLVMDTKTRQSNFDGMLISTHHHLIPKRFNIRAYTKAGVPQTGTVDVRLIFELGDY